jgi:1-acyl-sn-glycerol-3-phosphate acyltransferase
MSLMKYIKLARGEYASIRDSYEEAGYWLRQGVSVLFFPEGTRSPSGQIGDFKNGAFKLAIKEKRPILPIRIEGSRNIIPPGSWIFKARTSCRVSVLPEIDSRTFPPQDFALLREKTHQALSAAAD